MTKRKDTEEEILRLQAQLASFEDDLTGQSYADFIANNGCINCDGRTAVLYPAPEPYWITCPFCEGKTPKHLASFRKRDSGGTYHLDLSLRGIWEKLNPSVKWADFLTLDQIESRVSMRERLRDLEHYLRTLPEDYSDIRVSLGDRVEYQGKEFRVFWVGKDKIDGSDRIGIRPVVSRSATQAKDGIFVNPCVVKVTKSISSSLPDLVGVSAKQISYGEACRKIGIRDGASAENLAKQTRATWWINNFGPEH